MKLPPIYPFNGDWSTYVEDLYRIYVNEIVNGKLNYEGLPIKCRLHPSTRGKGFGFWHAIQEGAIEEDRQPDLRRCERLHWIPWIIRQAKNDPGISVWEEERGSETNIMLWIENENYLVILARRKGYILLKSAYYTERRHKIETLRKNRETYWKTKKN